MNHKLELSDRLIRRRELLDIIGICNTALYDMIRSDRFPKPLKLNPPNGRAVAWRGRDVIEWMNSRESGK